MKPDWKAEEHEGYRAAEMAAARELYLSGMGVPEIQKAMVAAAFPKLPGTRIGSWIKRGRWDRIREEVSNKARAKLVETLADAKARQLILCREAQERFKDKLDGGRVNLSPSDVLGMMKHELLIWGEATDRVEGIVVKWKELKAEVKDENVVK